MKRALFLLSEEAIHPKVKTKGFLADVL